MEKKKFQMPHTYIIIFGVILVAALLTCFIPLGKYDTKEITYTVNGSEKTRTVVDPDSFQYILDENGNEQPIVRKLSKRWGDPSFEDLLQKGYLKEAIINYIALLGWAPKDTNEEFFSMDDLIRIFDENGINKSPSIFDTNKLTWFNAEYIRRLPAEKFVELATPWIDSVVKSSIDKAALCGWIFWLWMKQGVSITLRSSAAIGVLRPSGPDTTAV